MKSINFELRKGFLKELHLLRQTYFYSKTREFTNEEVKKYSKVHLFNFDEGLDEKIVDLLNAKVA